MKTILYAITLLSVLLLAGCSSPTGDAVAEVEQEKASVKETVEEVKEAVEEPEEGIDEATLDVIEAYVDKKDKVVGILKQVVKHEENTGSKALINNMLSKIVELKKLVAEAETALGEVEALDFEEKGNLVENSREFFKKINELAVRLSEYYEFSLELVEYTAKEEKEDKIEDLIYAIANCMCDKSDCNSYKEESLKFLDYAIKTLKGIKARYGLEAFGKAAEMKEKEKAIHENKWPDLIRKSKSIHADSCYQIADSYNKYLAQLEKIEEVTDSEVDDEFSSKWFVPFTNIRAEIDQAGLEMDKALSETGFEII